MIQLLITSNEIFLIFETKPFTVNNLYGLNFFSKNIGINHEINRIKLDCPYNDMP